MAAGRKALLVATYEFADADLRRLTAPGHDAEDLAAVLRDPAVAGFDVTVLLNEPTHVVGEAIADFYGDCRREDLALLYFSGHGLKDDNGRLYLAMTNTRRDSLLFTGLSAVQIDEAMEACASRRKVLILDCCYSGAFPAGSTPKSDETVHALERFQGKGRAVLTASDATQYSFEGEHLEGTGSRSVFTRYLVDAIRTGEADLDGDGDIALDELYGYVRDRVVAERPQQRPKKQEDVDGRIVIARNVHWTLPAHLRYAIDSPLAPQRLSAVEALAHLYRAGNDLVRAEVARQVAVLAADDSRAVSAAAEALQAEWGDGAAPAPAAQPVTVAEPAVAPEPVIVAEPPAVAPDPAVVAGPPAVAPEPAAAPVAAAEPRAAPAAAVEPRAAPAAPAPGAAAPARRWWILAGLLVAAGLLAAARALVFERVNGYLAGDVGWTTAIWTLEVTLPLLLAAALLLAPRARLAAAALGAGLLAGVALSLIARLLAYAAAFPGLSYRVGPAWWVALIGAVVLAAGVATAVSAPWLRAVPHRRRDPVALVAALVVGAALFIWVLAVGSVGLPIGEWLFYKGAGVLFTLCCLAVALLRLTQAERLFALAAVSVFAAGQLTAGIEILVHGTAGFDTGAVLRAVLAVLLALAACVTAQLRTGSRPRSQAAPVTSV